MSNPSNDAERPFWDEPTRKMARRIGRMFGICALVVLVIALIANCTAPVETNTSTPAPSAPAKTTAAPKPAETTVGNKVTVKKVGDQFEVGSGTLTAGAYMVLKGWSIGEQYGTPVFVGKVKNVSEDTKNPVPNLQLKFTKGAELVMSFVCTANALEPGQITKLNCASTDPYTKTYDKISAETGLT